MTLSRRARRWVVASSLVGAVPVSLSACATTTPDGGSGGGGTAGTPGASGSGGAAPGGSGGMAPGGTSSGGTSTGGTSNAGTSTGGTMTGGTSTGGTLSGGSSSGGAAGASGGVAGSGGAAGASGGTAGANGGKGGSGGSGGGTCTTPTSLKAGDQTLMITVDGMQRSFIVHAPPSYNGTTRMPVVFDFHGLGGNASMWRNASRWRSVGDTQGFITVYPQGLPADRPGWNAGGCCTTVADDVAFTRAMITHLQTNGCVDSKRIHATGCSNGGAMSYMLACRASDVIASVAPVDFDCVVGGQCSQCNAPRPITEIQFRGTNDSAVPYGTETSGARANFTQWGTLNQCTGTAGPLTANASCQTYPMCGAGVETILCTVQNGTHCGSYSSFMIPELAWEVLKRHPLP